MDKYFRKIVKFQYKDTKYQLFMDRKNHIAFLELDDKGRYHYPKLEELLELVNIFATSQNVLNIRSDKIQKYKFTPKVLHKGLPLLLTLSLLSGCAPATPSNQNSLRNIMNNVRSTYSQTTNEQSTSEKTTSEKTTENFESIVEEDETASYIDLTEEEELINQDEIDAKYLALLALADDEYDYMYASDYKRTDMLKFIYIRDSKAYQEVFGYSNISVKQIEEALNDNNNIPKKYKDFILQYVKDWNTLFPGSDFSILYTNIKNGMAVKELTKEDMLWATLATDALACWKTEDNTIYVLEGIDLDKSGDGYIIFSHELTHGAKRTKFEDKNGYVIRSSFYEDIQMGYYSEEALITCFAYMLQGLGNKSYFYTLQSSYYRIILDAIDYDGADFLNHSVNYLIDKMDEYMEDDQYAYHIISLIDAEASLRYTDYIKVDFHEFGELYSYITRMYMKKYLTTEMTYEEAEEVYQNLMDEITYFFDQMKRPYEIDFDVFDSTFKECVNELGIQNNSTLGTR